MDSSNFEGISAAGIAALTGDQSWLVERNNSYKQRRDIIINHLGKAGFSTNTPSATIYIWSQIPEGFTNEVEFCTRLLDETGVSVTPGIVYGEHGRGYIRISLGNATKRIEEAMNRIAKWF